MEDDRIDLLTQVAIWYYEEGLNQADIAQRIDKSRSMVSRLLEQAREAGLVEVRVRHPLRTDSDLEQKLCKAYNLAEAHVLAEPPDDHQLLLRRLGELGARRLQASLQPGIIIGVSWGTGVHSLVSAMPTMHVQNSTVVQLIGAVGHGDPMVDGLELGRWLAQKLGSSFRFLSAPLLVQSEEIAQALRLERINQETLEVAARAEVAVIGIGTPEPDHSSLLRAGYANRADLEELVAAGVVGDIVAHQFDANGRLLDIPANRRTVSLDAESIRRIPLVIAVSGSVAKAKAIAAALRGGFCNCLVTDAWAAQMVLSMAETTPQDTGRFANAAVTSDGALPIK
ncbi:MAG: sugar-binding domain-containing protein [Caldilineales bacterium]